PIPARSRDCVGDAQRVGARRVVTGRRSGAVLRRVTAGSSWFQTAWAVLRPAGIPESFAWAGVARAIPVAQAFLLPARAVARSTREPAPGGDGMCSVRGGAGVPRLTPLPSLEHPVVQPYMLLLAVVIFLPDRSCYVPSSS